MSKRFTRNIRSIKDIEKQPKNTNQQNDLLSDDKHVYVRNKDQYENLTNSVKSVNDETIDEKGNVTIDTGVHKVNGKRSDDKGNVKIDTGVMQVNGEDPDEQGNIEVDSGVKTVTNVAPDENGNVDLQIKDFKEQKKLVRKNQLDEALENIESGYKNYTDNAVEGYATKQYVDNIDIPEQPDLSQYRTKQEIEELIKTSLPKFENEELIMSGDFENAFPDTKSTRLQYVLQGNMMQIFGLIRTKVELTGKSTHVVGKIPDKFNLITEGYDYGTMGARYHFKTLINDQTDSNYPNKVTIRRITDTNNDYVDLSADEEGVFHISLTIGVEVNG